MDAAKFPDELRKKAALLEQYVRYKMPKMVVRKTIRFIDGNFRAQGWQGRIFLPWQKTRRGGTILVRSGNLRRSIHSDTFSYQARIYTNSPYARVHNRGFNGTVNVRAHTRFKYTAIRVPTGKLTRSGTPRTKTMHQATGMTQVQAHQRHMNTPKRQFMPEGVADSPILISAIKRQAVMDIKAFFN